MNAITNRVWDIPDDRWTPNSILKHSPTERQSNNKWYDVNIKHLCAAVVYPDTGVTLTQYKKLANDPNNTKLQKHGAQELVKKLE